ncbi:RcnB family protein [Burkholderia thailandensis]|nr:RcnB family protein [Burkholderia thailandensis]AHI63154.1 hypothetical protein BTL_2647 [Burkholderia thailandensis H0587]AHI72846.1 hypothetical protein BTQ_1014 [Burkholderia thailandensis 2002721723]AHI79702.1 hypothetical protein BTJ_1419 [Burkholderia thailandensis E444]AIC86532.1 hypothetical protein BTRA_3013 [Burkholderia thailandensis USAMRU Malaysia \
MKAHRTLWISMLAAGALVSSLAAAQPHGRGGPGDERHGPPPGRHVGGDHGKRGEYGGPRPGEHRGDENAAWHRGDRLPDEYRDRQYVIDDWRGYHLSPPPRGYHWVGIGGDYLLVRISTGVILQIGP